MSEENKRLGGNPLSFLTGETEKEESEKVLRDNLISYKARKKCANLRYSKEQEQHFCNSPRSRQRGFLGKGWKEKCRQCHVKVVDDKEPEPESSKKDPPRFLTRILSIR